MSAKVKPYVCLKGVETHELSDHCSSCLAHPPPSLFCSTNTHPGTKQTVTSDHPAKAKPSEQDWLFSGKGWNHLLQHSKTTRLCRRECEAHTQHVAGSKPVDCYATLVKPWSKRLLIQSQRPANIQRNKVTAFTTRCSRTHRSLLAAAPMMLCFFTTFSAEVIRAFARSSAYLPHNTESAHIWGERQISRVCTDQQRIQNKLVGRWEDFYFNFLLICFWAH